MMRADDANTTADNLAALLAFYDRFPEYRNRTLYLAGESYSGHFIPLLAQAIVEYNKQLPAGEAPIPLDAYAIVNAWSDPVSACSRLKHSVLQMAWLLLHALRSSCCAVHAHILSS